MYEGHDLQLGFFFLVQALLVLQPVKHRLGSIHLNRAKKTKERISGSSTVSADQMVYVLPNIASWFLRKKVMNQSINQ